MGEIESIESHRHFDGSPNPSASLTPQNESPAPRCSADTGLEKASLLGGCDDCTLHEPSPCVDREDYRSDAPPSLAVALADLQREYAIECLRVVVVLAGQAQGALVLGMDGPAEDLIRATIAHVRESARAFREMQAALTNNGAAA